MRNFSWHVFATTGQIDAYLLYKDLFKEGGPSSPDQRPAVTSSDHPIADISASQTAKG